MDITGLASAQRQYDAQLPQEVIAEDYEPTILRAITDADVEQFILDIAVNGRYSDELGEVRQAPELYVAVAIVWCADKEKVGGIIGPAFWQWAKSMTSIAKFGK